MTRWLFLQSVGECRKFYESLVCELRPCKKREERKSMKIGITCYPTYGGSGVVATEMGKELAALGHEIHFISYAIPIKLNSTSELIHFHEVEMLNYPLFEHPPYALALATKMAEVATHQNLDLLHVHYAIPHSVS